MEDAKGDEPVDFGRGKGTPPSPPEQPIQFRYGHHQQEKRFQQRPDSGEKPDGECQPGIQRRTFPAAPASHQPRQEQQDEDVLALAELVADQQPVGEDHHQRRQQLDNERLRKQCLQHGTCAENGPQQQPPDQQQQGGNRIDPQQARRQHGRDVEVVDGGEVDLAVVDVGHLAIGEPGTNLQIHAHVMVDT